MLTVIVLVFISILFIGQVNFLTEEGCVFSKTKTISCMISVRCQKNIEEVIHIKRSKQSECYVGFILFFYVLWSIYICNSIGYFLLLFLCIFNVL